MFVTLLLTASAALTVRAVSGTNTQTDRDKITAAALAQAKDALIGRAVSDSNRPGSLPCPDIVTNLPNLIPSNVPNDGIADILPGHVCPSYIGRLPWKTLDLPDLRDGYGERLWYVLSPNFRDDSAAQPINSDTLGNRQIYVPITTYDQVGTLLTTQAVAIIFSPGDVLPNQNRNSTNINIASNYLESINCPSNCRTNTIETGPFIAGPILDTNNNPLLNDKLLIIQTKDIIPAVEKRVAKELTGWLQAYFTANGYYPYPAKYNACDQEDCRGDSTVCRGRIPKSEASDSAIWNPPPWFRNNQWYREIYYSVGAGSLQTPAGVTCANSLTVSGSSVRAVFFTPGTPIGTITRPSNTLSDYLEDPANQDGWSAGANDVYIIPSAPALDRDRLISLP